MSLIPLYFTITGFRFLLFCPTGEPVFFFFFSYISFFCALFFTKLILCNLIFFFFHFLIFNYFYSGLDHTVTQNKVVATQTLESLLQILAFMGFGLITRMVLTLQIVILTIPSIRLRYLKSFFFSPYIIVFWHQNHSKFCS